ncbi:MAG: hypothetical protein GC172_11640 [Phycisphaera sp.]|nr:hypothetical protein [Phycisphaera sp.]
MSFTASVSRPRQLAVLLLALTAASRVVAEPVPTTTEAAQTGSKAASQGQVSPKPSDAKGGGAGSESPQSAGETKAPSGSSPSKPPRSLDDLLGVPSSGASGSSAESAAEREQERRLERALEEASLEDLVDRAVDGMRSASERLEVARDPGVGTQRIQEDVVRTLARLLEEAERQSQSKSRSKSSSSRQSGNRRSSNEDPSERNGQQSSQRDQSSAQQASQSQPGDGDGESTQDRPPDQATADGVELEESRIEWGQLPERVRELVLQGRRDRVSSIYERLTREYYRRLAEEASK